MTGDAPRAPVLHSVVNLPRDPFAKLPALAKRLGVEPTTNSTPDIGLHCGDGTTYDFFELISALLDHMERATSK